MLNPRRGRANATIVWSLVGLILAMAGLSFAAVPLYRMFCAATGYGGTPQIGGVAPVSASRGTIAVRFDANIAPGLPWRFWPERAEMAVTLGEEQGAFYEARNDSTEPITGVATYNVTPEKAARYFHKTACFCFNQQTLAPRQEMQFPLSFWVDPRIATDAAVADVTTITLSYTFFRSLDDAEKSKHGPHVGPRADLGR
jgi:cytochrome c oxidase assembly protein subunit 11